MQRATTNTAFIKDDASKVIGFNLGWDCTTEHECGICPLIESFGLPLEEELGFEARRNTKVPPGLFYFESNTAGIICLPSSYSSTGTLERITNGVLRLYENEELSGAWDESSFGINARLEHKSAITELYSALTNENAVIMFGGRIDSFSNPGFLLLDYSKISQAWKDTAREKDREKREEKALYRRVEQESGVFEALRESRKTFFSLSIKGIDKNGKPRWWLNPLEQHRYNAGWYTTEELIQWSRNEGPIEKR